MLKKGMLDFFQQIKKFFFDTNTYISLQLLFTWALFKILGLFKILLLYRLLISFLFFLILLVYWKPVIRCIVNNTFFQFYVFCFLHVNNIMINYKWLSFILAFSFSLNYGLINNFYVITIFENKNFFIPKIDSILVVVFLFSFIHKLCNNVFYEEMKDGFVLYFFSSPSFTWFYIVNLFNSYFKGNIKMTNKISKRIYNYFPYTSFPFSFEFLQELVRPENSFSFFFEKLGGIRELKTEEERKSYALFNTQRLKNLSKFLPEHREMNNEFHKSLLLGLLLGFLVATFLLNTFSNFII